MTEAEMVKQKCPLKAAPGYVIVEPKAPMQESAGGIVLPAIAQEQVCEGVVIDHCKGPVQLECLEVYDFLPGELVVWGRYSDREYKVGDVVYKILAEADIIATIPSAE